MYSKKVMEHFQKPHNYGRMKNPDGVGCVGNPQCGDVMKLYIKVWKNKKGEEIIKDILFETFGCAAAISTSSVVTDLAKGKTLKEALKIDNKKIVESLGGLPLIKIHCSVLGADALKKAIQGYQSKKKDDK
ncbi:iron-sulfur cluster assembly scaffold protein [Patescibacteria group bacterium]|nr:iron-sulfur cluster assembly scaffold protein [Patescibacteria group bacterium]